MTKSSKLSLRSRCIAAGLLIAVGLFVCLPEAVVWWYGRGFEDSVAAEATAISPSSEYCIWDEDKNILVSDFSQLDKKTILRRAFYSALRHSPVNSSRWRMHHFRLVVDTKTYYWSFKGSTFYYENRSGFQLDEELRDGCVNFLRFPDVYRAAYRELHNVVVSKTNFCCPSLEAGAISL